MTKDDQRIKLRLKAHSVIMNYLANRYSFDPKDASSKAYHMVKNENIKNLKKLIEAYKQ